MRSIHPECQFHQLEASVWGVIHDSKMERKNDQAQPLSKNKLSVIYLFCNKPGEN